MASGQPSMCDSVHSSPWPRMQSNDSFRILALDGGAARGIYGAQILARLEGSLGAHIKDYFDLIAGTSTGSILAGAAAVGIPLADIVKLFESEAPRIFRKRPLITSLSMLWCSGYSPTDPRQCPSTICAPADPRGRVDSPPHNQRRPGHRGSSCVQIQLPS